MIDETRRAVDEAALELLGWTDLEWVTRNLDWEKPYWRGRNGLMWGETGSPSKDDCFIGPLAKALRAKGWHVDMQSSLVRPGQWEVVLTPNDQVYQSESDKAEIAFADTIPEALASAASKAMEKE